MKKLLLIFSVTFLLTACKKEVDELPPATDTGANSFGAKLDGELWVPQKFGIAPTAALVEARYGGNHSVFINARNFASSPTETEFELYIRHITAPGIFHLNANTDKYPHQTGSYGYFIKRRFMPLNEWITGSQHTGFINVTKFDTVNHIISGTFEFTAVSMDNTAAPIVVTEGRFDAKLQ